MKNLWISLKFTLAMCAVLTIGYVLVLRLTAAVASPNDGEAPVVELNGKVVGAANVGQAFTDNRYFWGRPSAVDYNGGGSGGSNKGTNNPEYLADVEARIEAFLEAHPYLERKDVPAEMVTASGSGLDPDISPRGAEVQIRRVAEARGMSEDQVREIVEETVQKPWLGLFGYTLGVLAVSAVISIKLFHIRKSETAGESYSFKFVPAVISTVISMAGGYLIGMIASSTYTFSELDFWVFFILGSLLSSIVFGVIANRGFKKLYSSFIRGGVAIVLTVVAVITVALVSAYNVQYLPKAENVKEISAFDGNCTYTEREDIETFIKLHNTVIENYKEGIFVKYYEVFDVIYNTEGFNFEYVMTNGKKVERDYGTHAIFAKNSSHLVLKLLCSDAFYKRYNDCITPDNGLIVLTMDGKNESIPISAEVAKNIIDTFKTEMRSADTDIFSEGCFYINIRGKGDRHIYIPKSFTETVKLVEGLLPEKV